MALITAKYADQQIKGVKEDFLKASMVATEQSYAKQILKMYDTDEYTEIFTSSEGTSKPEWFDERENLVEQEKDEGYKTTFESREFGHKIVISKKARLKIKDNTTKFNKLVNDKFKQAINGMYSFIEINSHDLLNNGFNSTYLAPDGENLFSTTHSYKNGTTFDNVLTNSMGVAAFDELSQKGWNFKDSQGEPNPKKYNTIVVKEWSTAAQNAKKTLTATYSGQYQTSTIGDLNIYKINEYTIIESPYIQDSTNFTADTGYFAFDNREKDFNSLFMSFVQRPMVEERVQDGSNLDWIYPWTASMKFGIRTLPTNIVGFDGTV